MEINFIPVLGRRRSQAIGKGESSVLDMRTKGCKKVVLFYGTLRRIGREKIPLFNLYKFFGKESGNFYIKSKKFLKIMQKKACILAVFRLY